MTLGLQDQGGPHWCDDGDGYWPIKSLPQVHYPLVLQYASMLSSIPRRLTPTVSYVQVLVANLRTPLCLSLPPRTILLAPRIRHYPHLRWCCPHGRHRDCLPLNRDAHGVLCVCPRRVTMESDADPVEKEKYGDGYARFDGVLAGTCNGFHTSVCEHGD
jgi:hypothetical protein